MRPRTGSTAVKPAALWIGLGILLPAAAIVILALKGVFMPGFETTKLGSVDLDIPYCTQDGETLELDIHYPDAGGPWPALVFVHGGGWTEGDKQGVLITPAMSGYLVASINYRMYPAHQFPAMIVDVKCAVRYLRAHARQYNIDPERIALVGHSAGGHLVALAGLADESAGWDVGEYADRSSRVQAVVVISAPSDLAGSFNDEINDLILNVFGADQLGSGSPVTYASPDDPPFLIIHGDADPLVPVEQAYRLHAVLGEAGVSSDLLIVRNGGHGLEPVGAGNTTPSGDAIVQQAVLFLNQVLQYP